MKKIWLLLLAMMCVGMAQAQDDYKQLVKFGDFTLGNECVMTECVVREHTMERNFPAPIAGIGKDESKGVSVVCPSSTGSSWDTMLWIVLGEEVSEGEQIKVDFDYKASSAIKAKTYLQDKDFNDYDYTGIGDVEFTTEWKHFSKFVRVPINKSSWSTVNSIKSINFQLGHRYDVEDERTEDVTFYIDNVSVFKEVWNNAEVTGSCGTGLKWSFNKATATLTIDGEGAMTDYAQVEGVAKTSTAPWYEYKDQIQTVVVNEGVISIGDYAFSGLTNLASVRLPKNSLTTLNSYAFWGCTSLTNITLPSSLSLMQTCVFCESGLVDVSLPSLVTTVPEKAFFYCKNLESVYFNQVETVGSSAFMGCEKLKLYYVPATFKEIKEYAFAATAIEILDFPQGLTKIERYAFRNTPVKSVTFKSGLEELGVGVFNMCVDLSEVTLPEGFQTISNGMFNNCSSLSTITIPASVTSIGKQALSGTSITDVTCLGTTPATCYENTFDIDNETSKIPAKLHVPEGSSEVYSATSPWNKFMSIDEPVLPACSIYIPHMSIAPGEVLVMPIMVKNNCHVDDFFGTINLPEGFSVVENEGDQFPYFKVNYNRFETEFWVLCSSFWSGTGNQPAVYFDSSVNPAELKQEDAVALILLLKADANLKTGSYEGEINFNFNNQSIVDTSKFTFTVKDPFDRTPVQGDTDGDGEVSIGDVNKVVDILLKKK